MYSNQLHTFHPNLHFIPSHYTYMYFTSHNSLIPFHLPHLADLHPTSNSLHFTSFHFTSLITFQTLFLELLDFLRTSNSLHVTSLNTFLTLYTYTLDFPSLQNPFTSLHSSHFSPRS